jgi:hypothetical protein
VGSGRSLEAPYPLEASVPAGDYHVICDAIIIGPVDVTFEFVHRRGGTDTIVGTWMEHFEPRPEGFEAQTCEVDMPGTAIEFQSGDLFVFRYSGANSGTVMQAYIPVGNPESEGGRAPNITFPR